MKNTFQILQFRDLEHLGLSKKWNLKNKLVQVASYFEKRLEKNIKLEKVGLVFGTID